MNVCRKAHATPLGQHTACCRGESVTARHTVNFVNWPRNRLSGVQPRLPSIMFASCAARSSMQPVTARFINAHSQRPDLIRAYCARLMSWRTVRCSQKRTFKTTSTNSRRRTFPTRKNCTSPPAAPPVCRLGFICKRASVGRRSRRSWRRTGGGSAISARRGWL